MSEKTILVIDDSATIRRLVDSELSSSGYRVVLAETAEKGIDSARAETPDLILLDHQLPGTTGFDVCSQLLADSVTAGIPVVVSSTLRKKAYVEYTDCSNVVDMLPKPYTGELLRTTVANALETAAMIVQSQSQGTAVPEVIHSLADSALQGSMSCFGVRELLDFLNNGSKKGMVEFESSRGRISVFIDNGRIQAVTATGVDARVVAETLPPALADLAPMIKFTISGKQNSQIDGLVELLNNKVLDARLLRQLLRHQAAILIHQCLVNKPTAFRFDANQAPAVLFSRLPLDTSLLALFVDASQAQPLEDDLRSKVFVRQAIRGQNLDRAGLSGQNMKLLSLINGPVSADDLASQSGCSVEETSRVLRGLEWSELIQSQPANDLNPCLFICGDPQRARSINQFLQRQNSVSGKIIRDPLAVKLYLRRFKPTRIVVDLDHKSMVEIARQVHTDCGEQLSDTRWIGLVESANSKRSPGQPFSVTYAWEEFERELQAEFEDPLSGTDAKSNVQLANCP